eukprot:6193245-Pleurochrysis_carterae.AAC.1
MHACVRGCVSARAPTSAARIPSKKSEGGVTKRCSDEQSISSLSERDTYPGCTSHSTASEVKFLSNRKEESGGASGNELPGDQIQIIFRSDSDAGGRGAERVGTKRARAVDRGRRGA